MINIFDYLDYRAFLHESYIDIKKVKPYFSIRFISGKIGLNPGYILKVFQSKVHLGTNNIPAFADLLNLEDKERAYFIELVHFGRAKSENELTQRFDNLQLIKGVQFRTVADNSVDFFRNWYNMAIRSLLSIYPFKGTNYRKLGTMLTPSLTASQVRESINLLKRLKMIEKDGEGYYRVTETFISTGEKWMSPVIREYQQKNMELAIKSLHNHKKVIRDISTVTMTLPIKQMSALSERIKQFRQELLLMSQEYTGDDAVIQLNIQVFPTAIVPEKKK